MKEIKFRGFNTKTKKMLDLQAITPLSLNADLPGLFLPKCEDVILMQYTGLKDKNGKEIYEGDIIRNFTDYNIRVHGKFVDYEVITRNGQTMFSYLKAEKGQTLPKGYPCGSASSFQEHEKEFYFADDEEYITLKDFEIIGNIYENAEGAK